MSAYANDKISAESDRYCVISAGGAITQPLPGRYCVIMGGHNVHATGNNTWILSATPRKFDTSDIGKLYLRADNGVMIETAPDVFINASELLAELQEYKTMVRELYYAPPYGPGYLKSLESFIVQKEGFHKEEEIEQDPSTQ